MGQHIETAVLYGNLDEYAYYFLDLLVGTPPQRVSVILDTGSSICAFSCASCKHCGRHLDPNFDFAKSKTAKWDPCGSGCSYKCKSNRCSYFQGYQEGSSLSGFWFSDLVSIGDTGQQNPPIRSRLGCHHDESGLFYMQKANGIFGLRGQNSVLQNLFKDRDHVESKVFAICLADQGGRLVVGGYDTSYHRGNITWVKTDPGIYGVSVTGMNVGEAGKTVTGFGLRAIVDSGSTFTYMASAPYKALRAQIENYCRSHKNCGAIQQGSCWKLTSHSGLSAFPEIEVHFGRHRIVWEARSYLYLKGARANRMHCYAFEDDGPGKPLVLGASWMLYHEVIFDLRANKLGIVKAECPHYRKRPAYSTKGFNQAGSVATREKHVPSQKLLTFQTHTTSKNLPPQQPLISHTTSIVVLAQTEPFLTSSTHATSRIGLLSTTSKSTLLYTSVTANDASLRVGLLKVLPFQRSSPQAFVEFALSSGSVNMFVFIGAILFMLWWRRVGRGLCTIISSLVSKGFPLAQQIQA